MEQTAPAVYSPIPGSARMFLTGSFQYKNLIFKGYVFFLQINQCLSLALVNNSLFVNSLDDTSGLPRINCNTDSLCKY